MTVCFAGSPVIPPLKTMLCFTKTLNFWKKHPLLWKPEKNLSSDTSAGERERGKNSWSHNTTDLTNMSLQKLCTGMLYNGAQGSGKVVEQFVTVKIPEWRLLCVHWLLWNDSGQDTFIFINMSCSSITREARGAPALGADLEKVPDSTTILPSLCYSRNSPAPPSWRTRHHPARGPTYRDTYLVPFSSSPGHRGVLSRTWNSLVSPLSSWTGFNWSCM